jgi:hypothetical protein
MGLPLLPEELWAQAADISRKEIGKKWHLKFIQCHPEVVAARSTKLDLRCAKNFNKIVINDYFDKLEQLHLQFPGGVPPKHIWNMDEKGIQIGGGCGRRSRKYYFLVNQKYRQRMASDNLELVTILKCISAAGAVVLPSFCLQNGTTPDLRHLNDDD